MTNNVAMESTQQVLKENEALFTCKYCNVECKTKEELITHCQTSEHQVIVMSDEGRNWKWRPPPRGFTVDSYKQCEDLNCYLGNSCTKAHGLEELHEWIERFEYRQAQLQSAYDNKLIDKSYTEGLLQKCMDSNSGVVLNQKLEGVAIQNSNELSTHILKSEVNCWSFKIESDLVLRSVCLLYDTHRSYFVIDEIAVFRSGIKSVVPLRSNQECTDLSCKELEIRIKFESNIYGTFRQTLVFDFGLKELLVRNLYADVVPKEEAQVLDELNQEITAIKSACWTESNSEIVEFSTEDASFCTNDQFHKGLLETYPYLQTCNVSSSTAREKQASFSDYKQFLHDLLYVEEVARNYEVDKYSFNARLHIVNSYLLTSSSLGCSIAKYANFGELYACMNLNQVLSEDTSGGRLILTNCSSVLLRFKKSQAASKFNRPLVYEATIEDRGKNVIYLRLSAKTVSDLKLFNDFTLQVQIQFRLNRIPYCEWHYAVDSIREIDLLFPEAGNLSTIPWSPQKQWSETIDHRLNPRQKEAVIAITCYLNIRLPPILIIGPFGTGKTYTMAQAIKQLVQQDNTKILICTHSNSAADLYIKDYLHPFVEDGHSDAKPLRLYYLKRWVSTVHPIVQQYCLIRESNGEKNFFAPTIEDIQKHRIIVVTLSTSIYLSLANLPHGYFTHILIDEAAQTMECESIMPLSLANESTRIVLAGDYMQLSPEVFSQFAKERKLHVSILERLYHSYPKDSPCKILLRENYRSHDIIVEFISESFYNEKLLSSGKQKKHPTYHPLTFFTVLGEDLQDTNSTSFCNNSEVFEIVEKVASLRQDWPVSVWGEFDENSIGIMTPYADQVFRVRSELRKRKLKNITVERVTNAQGKQFRAVFLSTVRTRNTCTCNDESENDYGFLSNLKLLNTAITRAQSLVAVVGDPIALCSVGLCGKIWEKYIQMCSKNESLFGIEWKYIKLQLDGLELKKIYGLNPLAPEFVPSKKYSHHNEPYIKVYVPPFQTQCKVTPVVSHVPAVLNKPYLLSPLVPGKTILPTPPLLAGRAILPTTQVSPILRTYYGKPLFQVPPFPYPVVPGYVATPNSQNMNVIVNQPGLSNMVQLMDHVHLPGSGNGSGIDSLHDLVNLLPENMSLAEMLLQPEIYHRKWYEFLLEYRGAQAARKFEYLISTSIKKPQVPKSSSPASWEGFSKFFNSNNSVNTENAKEQSDSLNWLDTPANQLNVDKTVYLQRQQQTLFSDPINPDLFCFSKETSVPLYKRKPSQNRDEN